MKAVFNLNDYVYVQLNDLGREIHKDRYLKTFADSKFRIAYTPPVEDVNGWSKWQMHELMNTFGAHMYNGCNIPMNTTIQIELV